MNLNIIKIFRKNKNSILLLNLLLLLQNYLLYQIKLHLILLKAKQKYQLLF